MAEKSLSKNGIYYLIYNVLNVIFPFLTGIYVARVLLPDTIGKVASAQNIVQYFVIFAFLGIPTYGMREIAKARKNQDDLNKLYSELFIINSISTLFFTLLYFILVFSVPIYRQNIQLYSIVGISVALNFFNNTWLYDGLEEYKFISVRNIIFKILMFIMLVIFVKSEKDYLIYAAITVMGTAGNYLLNMLYSKKFVKFTFKNLNLKRHLKSILYLVIVNLAIEIYTLVDITMLDIFCDDDHVAYYSYASKINKVLLQIINTFTMVLIPRISLFYKEKKFDEFNRLLSKSLLIIIIISCPAIIGIQFTSTFLLTKIYGDIYIKSAYCLNILCIVLLISPIGYLLGSRTLLVSGHENKMIIAVGTGAVINILGNLLLIPKYAEIGASITSVISEVCVCIIYIFLGSKYFKLYKIGLDCIKIALSLIIMTLSLILIQYFVDNALLECILEVLVASIVYLLTLLITKERIIYDIFWKKIKKVFN